MHPPDDAFFIRNIFYRHIGEGHPLILVIFISAELGERIKDRAKVPVVIVNNFMDDKEVEEKVLAYFATLK